MRVQSLLHVQGTKKAENSSVSQSGKHMQLCHRGFIIFRHEKCWTKQGKYRVIGPVSGVQSVSHLSSDIVWQIFFWDRLVRGPRCTARIYTCRLISRRIKDTLTSLLRRWTVPEGISKRPYELKHHPDGM